jgi:phosphatidylserine/phosphatidylglycerophosphate/cardiolipin synthase-like enzyme
VLWNNAGEPDLKGKTKMQTLLPPARPITARPCRFFSFLLFVILTTLAIPHAAPQSSQTASSIQVYFSPRGGCQDAIVREVNNARRTIRIQAYYFTNAVIARAVRDAHRRGVNVEIILDKSQQTNQYSSATFFQNAGIPVLIDDKHAIAHDKVMILDGRTVITDRACSSFSSPCQVKTSPFLSSPTLSETHLRRTRSLPLSLKDHTSHPTV